MFLNPWALIVGAVAIGLPIAVHYFTKPRPVRLPLSTLRFVREALRVKRARHRLRDFLVLALRALAVALLALAVARPTAQNRPLIADGETGSAVRIVILDVSQSMAALQGGTDALQRGRTVAASLLRYRPGLHANLIIAAAQPRPVLTQPSQNFEAMREALARAQVRPERLDVNRALALAADALMPSSDSDTRRRELVVVSDFQRSNWANADFSCLPEATKIQLESTAAGTTPPNLALLGVELPGHVAVGGTAQLAVTVANYGPAARDVAVEVALGDATYRLEGNCAAGRRTTLTQDVASRQAGWQVGAARLVGVQDALEIDNQRAAVTQVRDRPQFVLISRQGALRRPSSSHFLECALVPDVSLGSAAQAMLVRMTPGEIDRERLASADLIVLDHPGLLQPEDVALLAGLVRRGHALLYVAGEPVDATNLHRFAAAAGTDLQLPVEFSPPAPGKPSSDLFLTSINHNSAPFDVFGDNASAVLSPLRFQSGLSSRRVDQGVQDDLLAAYNDGTACLVQSTYGAGSVAVLNTDLGRSHLPRTGAFVPLIDRLIEHLMQLGAVQQPAVCGEPLVVRLPAAAGSADQLRIVPPTGAGPGGTLVDEGAGVVWRWAEPDRVGVYQVLRDDQPVYVQAIHVADEESQLEALSADVFETRLSCRPRRSVSHAGRRTRTARCDVDLAAGRSCSMSVGGIPGLDPLPELIRWARSRLIPRFPWHCGCL